MMPLAVGGECIIALPLINSPLHLENMIICCNSHIINNPHLYGFVANLLYANNARARVRVCCNDHPPSASSTFNFTLPFPPFANLLTSYHGWRDIIF